MMEKTAKISGGSEAARAPSSLSVGEVGCQVLSASSLPLPLVLPATPARHRDIDSDMEAIRISRHDNPFIKQVLASRESLADSLEESESDDTNLMSQEFGADQGAADPLSLPEVHQHMVRSPPPVVNWPPSASPNFKMFRFPPSSEDQTDLFYQDSPSRKSSISPSRMSVSPRQERSKEFISERSGVGGFSLLTPAPLRSLTDVRRLHSRSSEESQQLVSGKR